jgi:hypothetical protein
MNDRRTEMKTKMILAMMAVTALVFLNGCGGGEQVKTGFLDDYSQLQKESDTCLRYVNDKALAGYSSFIVDPVVVFFHEGAKSKGKLTLQQLADLTNYLHTKIIGAVQGAGKKVADQPAKEVARIRVALTDMGKTGAINILPAASLLGSGIGGASMEAEIVDSMTGKQIAAVVESKKGSRMPFENLGDWTAAQKVMDSWADRFQERLSD